MVEIEDLSAGGLLRAGELRSARAEAARRLLAASDAPAESQAAGLSSDRSRWLVLITAALAPLLAVAVYMVVGSPLTPDQPFAARVAAWRNADPQTLDAPRMAAVLSAVAAERPDDPKPLFYLARADLAAGDVFAAERALRQAIAIAPRQADLWTALGMVLSSDASGQITGDALSAFQKAHAIDPAAPDPRYFLARARMAAGDVQGGLADWRQLSQDLPLVDPRRMALLQEIAVVEKTGAPPSDQAPAQPADTGAFVQSMVQRLAARLQSQPDDPEGWGRLIRAYGVLGDNTKRLAAVARAEQQFKGRPDALAAVQAAARTPESRPGPP